MDTPSQQNVSSAAPIKLKTSGFAISSFVLSIVSIWLFPISWLLSALFLPLAFILEILVIIFGVIALRGVKRGLVGGSSKGLAMAGIIIGGVMILLKVLFWLLFMSGFRLNVWS